jgi:hypothetical protein
MKKITITTFTFLLTSALKAQAPLPETFDPFKDRDFLFDTLHIVAILFGIYLISSFILQIFRNAMSYRIKNRILDKGTEENVVREILLPEKKENKLYILQWFFMLTAIGVGLLLVGLTRPFGLHSVAILAFSVAAGFGAYYYYSKEK